MFPSNNAVREGLFKHMAVPQQPQNDSGALQRMIDHARVTPIKNIDINDDLEAREMFAHVLKPDQTLAEFYATVGLSKAQAAGMTKAQISAFVAQAEKNAIEDEFGDSEAWQPRRAPAHFVID